MNTRLIDGWSLTHITSMFIVTFYLLSIGSEIVPIFITIVFITITYEILEHMLLFNLVKEKKEVVANSIFDVFFGLFGMSLAMFLYL